MFNRLREPALVDGNEFFSGYGCKGFGAVGERKWVASYDIENPRALIISLTSKETKLAEL